MRSIVYIATAACLSVLVACDDRGESACSRNALFCESPETWASKAKELKTQDVLALHGITWEFHRPPSEDFIRILALRGDDTVQSMILFISANEKYKNKEFVDPILAELRYRSKSEICHLEGIALLAKMLPDSEASARCGGGTQRQE